MAQTRSHQHPTEQVLPCASTFTWLKEDGPCTGHVPQTVREGEADSQEQRRTSPRVNYLEKDLNGRTVPTPRTHRLRLLEWEPSFLRLSPLLCSAGGPGWNILQIYHRGQTAASGFCQVPQGSSSPGSLPRPPAGPPWLLRSARRGQETPPGGTM